MRFRRLLPVLALARVALAQPAPVEPPAAAAPLPSDPPQAPSAVSSVPVRLSGVVHAMVLGTQGVQSFGYATPNAPTAALNRAAFAEADAFELSYQVQQTRIGLSAGDGTDLRGFVEVDFIHFDQSSPTTQAYPRLRQALLEWTVAPGHKLFLGQTWDLFGNATGPQLLSHSFNLVGTLFQAGNIGFMRHQAGWSGRFGELEAAAALGLQAANAGLSFGPVERAGVPTAAVRIMRRLGDAGVVGASAIATQLLFTNGAQEERRAAAGGVLFADLTAGPVNVHAEAYAARNLANLGALDLAQGRLGHDVRDAGGYVSAKWVEGRHAFTLMAGGATVLDRGAVLPAYTPAVIDATGAVTTPAALTPAVGPGLKSNLSVHAGYWFSPAKGFSLVVEPYAYRTRFALLAADEAKFPAVRTALGAMAGGLHQF